MECREPPTKAPFSGGKVEEEPEEDAEEKGTLPTITTEQKVDRCIVITEHLLFAVSVVSVRFPVELTSNADYLHKLSFKQQRRLYAAQKAEHCNDSRQRATNNSPSLSRVCPYKSKSFTPDIVSSKAFGCFFFYF